MIWIFKKIIETNKGYRIQFFDKKKDCMRTGNKDFLTPHEAAWVAMEHCHIPHKCEAWEKYTQVWGSEYLPCRKAKEFKTKYQGLNSSN